MLRKSPEHRPTVSQAVYHLEFNFLILVHPNLFAFTFLQAGELLRHSHVQPYLIRCNNPSSVFLLVKPTNNIKDKGRRRLSSGRYSDGKDDDETEVKGRKTDSTNSKIGGKWS